MPIKIHKQIFEERKLFILPLSFVVLLVLAHVLKLTVFPEANQFGVYPGKLHGLSGILFMPLLHGDWGHLFSNASSLLFLTLGLRYFYGPIFLRVFVVAWVVPALLTWFIGRGNYHIGASGMVYVFAAFLFFSGLFRVNRYLLALSLMIAFWYGGLVWGMFPLESGISWEGHLSGGIVGFLLAVIYRKVEPDTKFEEPDPWEKYDPNEEDPLIGDLWKVDHTSVEEKSNDRPKPLPPYIVYHYREKGETPPKPNPEKDEK